MAVIDTSHQRAAILIILLGIGLAFALAPYATGLIGAPVLYVICQPLNERLQRFVRPSFSAGVIVALTLLVLLGPGIWFGAIVVAQAQEMASGVMASPLLHRFSQLQIGRFDIGPTLADMGKSLVSWVGSSAFGLIGTATRMALNVTIAFFGLYYLLLRPDATWMAAQPFIPFSLRNAEILRRRFRDVTTSTLIGTGAVSVIQGTMLAIAFILLGYENAVFWGVVTAVFAVLPVVGSGLVWGPAAISLALDARWGAAIALVIWGTVVVGTVDNLIRPFVYRKWAKIHPIVTLVGAIAGIRFFGILGILIGPLALSYFFELIRMYRGEYLTDVE